MPTNPIQSKEILGLNRRNQKYVRPLNPPSAKKIADSKLLTKRMLYRIDIKSPELFKVIRTKKQLEFLDWDSLPKSFVLKPNQGTGGNGIIVFFGKKKGQLAWIRPNGQIMDVHALKLHIENILEGRFSMGNVRDIALIEERLKNDKLLALYSYRGVPDVRVIIYNKIPIMAELRLPTKESDGTANLHAGGIGVGIDIASGLTTVAIHRRKKSFVADSYDVIDKTLDLEENLPLRGIKIPYWDEILRIAVKCQIESGLGYVGVDIALDREKGPMVFELNARPGLAIQIANMAGLRARLERVEGLTVKSIKHGIRLAKDLFGGEIEEDIEEMSGKQIVNLVETVTIFNKPKTKIKLKTNTVKIKHETTSVRAILDTGVTTSRIDSALVSQIGFDGAMEYFQDLNVPVKFNDFIEAQQFIDAHPELPDGDREIVRLAKIVEDGKIVVKPVINVKLQIRGRDREFEAIVSSQKDMIYPIIIGRRELQDFLIDPSKTFVK
jgi:alpha-L-glutamate ligase-like protein